MGYRNKYKGVPLKINKKKDGSDVYSDRKSFMDALVLYAVDNKLDVDKFVKEINIEDDKSFAKNIKSFKGFNKKYQNWHRGKIEMKYKQVKHKGRSV